MKARTFLISDSQPVFRIGLKSLLSVEYCNVEDVIEVPNAREALNVIERQIIDCLLLEPDMSVLNDLAILSYLRKNKRSVRIIVLSSYSDPLFVHHLLGIGVHAYLSKNHDIKTLKAAISTVISGGLFYPEEYDQLIRNLIQSGKLPAITVSKGEREILELLACGMTGTQISRITGYTKRTVETKKCRLHKKLCVNTSPALIHLAHRIGILK